jgi:hypothetical protein
MPQASQGPPFTCSQRAAAAAATPESNMNPHTHEMLELQQQHLQQLLQTFWPNALIPCAVAATFFFDFFNLSLLLFSIFLILLKQCSFLYDDNKSEIEKRKKQRKKVAA